MKRRKRTINDDALCALRRMRREYEIATHNCVIATHNVTRNKRLYTRKTKHKREHHDDD